MILKNFWSPPLALKNRRCLPAKPSGIGIVGLGDIVIIGKTVNSFYHRNINPSRSRPVNAINAP